MTARETERLAKVEQKVDDMKESADTNFKALNTKSDALDQKLDDFIKHADKSFLTVVQAKLIAWLLTFSLGVVTLGYLIVDHFKAK